MKKTRDSYFVIQSFNFSIIPLLSSSEMRSEPFIFHAMRKVRLQTHECEEGGATESVGFRRVNPVG